MQDNSKDTGKRNKTIRSLQARFTCILTKPEGEALNKILADNGCKNLSQFCKKIVHGEPLHW